jgi:hypothetical protein
MHAPWLRFSLLIILLRAINVYIKIDCRVKFPPRDLTISRNNGPGQQWGRADMLLPPCSLSAARLRRPGGVDDSEIIVFSSAVCCYRLIFIISQPVWPPINNYIGVISCGTDNHQVPLVVCIQIRVLL